MSDDWKVQASYKHGRQFEHMLNVRADSAVELKQNLTDLSAHDVLETVVVTGELLGAVSAAGSVIVPDAAAAAVAPVTPIQALRQEATPPPPPPPPPVQPSGQQTCLHGVRTYRSGVGGKGPWGAYFCPQPKEATDKCEPIWVKP